MATSPTSSKHHSSSNSTKSVSSNKRHPAETSCTTHSVSSLEVRQKRFGPLLDIADESIISLALKVRNQVGCNHHKPSPETRLISRLNGSFNLVYIVDFDDGVKYVVRIPGTGWGDRYTESAKKLLESQVTTMRFVHDNTTIPVPEIYAFDSTLTNELGAPWTVMSFIPGSTVAELWNDEDGPTSLEDRRRRALETIAEAMSQLRNFQFDKIGSFELPGQTDEHSNTKIGPLHSFSQDSLDTIGDPDYGTVIRVEQAGPFQTSMSYMLDQLPEEGSLGNELDIGALKLNKMLLSHLPKSSHHPFSTRSVESFVLSFPDFDSQNIMIDERGNLTGLLDWDNVQTYPRFLGYCRYPSFIMRDWDFLGYEYPGYPHESSPEELARYRQIYLNNMTHCLGGKYDAIFTAKSHIFEALRIATEGNTIYRLEFMREFLRKIVPELEETDDIMVLGDLGEGALEPEYIKRLDKGIQELLSVQVPPRKWSLSSIWAGFSAFFQCGRKHNQLS